MIKNLTGEQAHAYIQERMMFPTADDLDAWGLKPNYLISSLDRLRDAQRRLKDNDSIEDYLNIRQDPSPRLTVNLLAHKLVTQVRFYKQQEVDVALSQRLHDTSNSKLFPDFGTLHKRKLRSEDELPVPDIPNSLRENDLIPDAQIKSGLHDFFAPIYMETRMPISLSDTPPVLTGAHWSMGLHCQSIGRLRRVQHVNAIVLPGKYASRNEREGVYAFKVKGKHTRKRRKPKIVVLTIEAGSQLDRLRTKAMILKEMKNDRT